MSLAAALHRASIFQDDSVFAAPAPSAPLGAPGAAEAPFELNPFGTWFTVATWSVLIALNLYCFLRLFSARPPVPEPDRSAEPAAAPVAAPPLLALADSEVAPQLATHPAATQTL